VESETAIARIPIRVQRAIGVYMGEVVARQSVNLCEQTPDKPTARAIRNAHIGGGIGTQEWSDQFTCVQIENDTRARERSNMRENSAQIDRVIMHHRREDDVIGDPHVCPRFVGHLTTCH
jgi:hypothetical protein